MKVHTKTTIFAIDASDDRATFSFFVLSFGRRRWPLGCEPPGPVAQNRKLRIFLGLADLRVLLMHYYYSSCETLGMLNMPLFLMSVGIAVSGNGRALRLRVARFGCGASQAFHDDFGLLPGFVLSATGNFRPRCMREKKKPPCRTPFHPAKTAGLSACVQQVITRVWCNSKRLPSYTKKTPTSP